MKCEVKKNDKVSSFEVIPLLIDSTLTLATTCPIIFPFLALCVLVELFVSLKNEFTHWCSRNYILKYLSICLKSLELLVFKVKLLYRDLNRE